MIISCSSYIIVYLTIELSLCLSDGSLIWQQKLVNVAALRNKLWSFIKQFVWIGVIKNFKFFLQEQLTFLGEVWIGWYGFVYGPFQWWHCLELLLYFPNILGKSAVSMEWPSLLNGVKTGGCKNAVWNHFLQHLNKLC